MVKLHFLKSMDNTINTSLIFESDGSVVVFDGGYICETDYLHEYLLNLGGRVDAWFMTHAHNDHVNACFDMLDKYNDITVKRAAYRFPSDEWLLEYDKSGEGISMARNLRRVFAANNVPVDEVEAGDRYEFDGFSVQVLRVPHVTGCCDINNTSVVYRVEAGGKSVLILGDLAEAGGRELLETVDPALIKADYCQMSHHGQDGVSQECYAAIRPTYCLWPTPSWLWDNMGPGGYDTGIFKTVIVRGWISALRCVKKHYLMTEGTHVIDLTAENE